MHWTETSAIQLPIECFHSRGQHLCKFIGTKESVCIRKEFNSHYRISLGHQHGRRFIVLGHQYGRRDVMWKHSIQWQMQGRGPGGSKKNFFWDCPPPPSPYLKVWIRHCIIPGSILKLYHYNRKAMLRLKDKPRSRLKSSLNFPVIRYWRYMWSKVTFIRHRSNFIN